MPMYDYLCEGCEHVFTELRPMAEHLEPHPCPGCGASARRIVGAPPHLNDMPQALRHAHETNERSAHEPRVGPQHRCGPGCGHQAAKAQPRLQPARGARARPWMLGH